MGNNNLKIIIVCKEDKKIRFKDFIPDMIELLEKYGLELQTAIEFDRTGNEEGGTDATQEE
jgi:hypothetical protein